MNNKNANMIICNVFTYEFLSNECKYKPNKQIAIENNCSISTVRKYLKKYSLQCFNPTNKGKIAWNKSNESFNGRIIYNRDNIDNDKDRRYHNIIRKHISRKVDTSHEVVHHIDRNPLNDDLCNLVLMEKCDHDRLHSILRNKHIYNCTLNEIIDYLFKENATDEMKRYAELTRIISNSRSVRSER